MYNVLIVDDEPWVAYGLTHLIDWESLGFHIIGEAHDGLTALAIIKDKRPQLIISDIRMPGLDGLELLEQIKINELDAKVILVSGYAEFEYAQKALRLGAYDYLLKQVDRQKLTETIMRLKLDLEQQEQSAKEFDVMLDDLFEWLEPDNTLTVGNFLANKGIATDYPHFRFLCSTYAVQTASLCKEGVIRGKDLDVLRVRTGQHKIAVLLSYDESKAPLHFLDYISEQLSDAQYTGISSIGLFSTPIAKLYQEADIAMCSALFHRGNKVLSYKLQELAPEIKKQLINLELATKEQTRDKIEQLLDAIKQYAEQQRPAIDQIAFLYNQIISIIYKYYGHTSRNFEIEHLNYEQICRYYGSLDMLFQRLNSFFELLTEAEIHIHNVQIEKVIAYIDSRFTEDILLSAIAKHFQISIGYLSTLIKKETGATYSDYILNKRLSLAKSLLSDPTLSVHEIVQRVGYKDYFHFNKLFKKHFGITPSKYRKL
jgi:two-component system response regulator YesN